MITTTTDAKTFVLTAQSAEDFELIHALDMYGMHLRCTQMTRSKAPSDACYISSGATLVIDATSPESHRADAGRQALRAFSELVRLGLGESAQHGLVSGTAANPQAQEQFASGLVQLQVVLDALREVIVQQKIVLKEMRSAHKDAFGGSCVIGIDVQSARMVTSQSGTE